MSEQMQLLHNMSAPPKSVVKYEGLSGLATRNQPGGSGVTSLKYKSDTVFGKAVRFSMAAERRALRPMQFLELLNFEIEKGVEFDPAKRLTALINQRANELPLPEGCAVIAPKDSHVVLWSDLLSALAILSKCCDSVWLRGKTPSVISAMQLGSISLLIPPNFVSQLPEDPC